MIGLKQCLVLAVTLLGAQVRADDAMEAAFLEWAQNEDMAPAAIVAINPAGQVVAELGVGADITTPMPIASISKSIAGQCAVYAARAGYLSLDDAIGTALGWAGPQGQVSFGALLTHTSGFGPDATQGDLAGRLMRSESRIATLVENIQTRPLAGPQGGYSYNNENYLVLEAALNEVLGEPALEWCRRNATQLVNLRTLGTADALGGIGLAGGLEISTRDLATFFQQLPSPQPDWPMVRLDDINSYGPGLVVQSNDNGYNLFHTGGICTFFGPNLGAFGAQLANGASIAMTYSGCADEDDLAFLNSFALDLLAND